MTETKDIVEYGGYSIEILVWRDGDLAHGHWTYSREGNQYGLNFSVMDTPEKLYKIILSDAQSHVDDIDAYGARAEEAQRVHAERQTEIRARRQQQALANDDTYQRILAEAVAKFGEGVEPYLQELWEYWYDN